MKYKLNVGYHWVDSRDESFIVKMYFIQEIPYTFDELPKIMQDDPALIEEASNNKRYTDEELYKCSIYLGLEEVHPLMHSLEYENPEYLPVD